MKTDFPNKFQWVFHLYNDTRIHENQLFDIMLPFRIPVIEVSDSLHSNLYYTMLW
jgi:hypothetical protein